VFTQAQPDEKRTAISTNLLRIQRKARDNGDLELELKTLIALSKVEGLELEPGLVVPDDEKSESELDARILELLKLHPHLRAHFTGIADA
jgi:hypothetical protein